jgi:glycosyltransferase involved in cell wall biosynthesis
MKVWIATLLRKTRELFEYFGIPLPAWMFRLANSVKVIMGVTTPPHVPPSPTNHVSHVFAEQRATDAAYMRSLHCVESSLPAVGMQLMVDLRVAQIHRERGIPRYAQTLLIELAKQRPDIRYSWLIEDGEMPLLAQSLATFGRFVRVEDIPSLPRITHYLQACLFDRSRDAAALFPPSLEAHQPQLAAIFYDMIPWVFPQLYLRDKAVAQGYMRAAELLLSLDRLFAISECSRIDAVAFGCDPQCVRTIYGGSNIDRFNTDVVIPPPLPAKYWLYIGGDDPRKNIVTLFRAFATVRQRMPDPPALVVVCGLTPARRTELLGDAALAGLDADSLVLTGYVPDGAMRAVIEGAIATIFPSLYEGLGLPVLESYQFGRAALVADNSSLNELAPPQCRFEAGEPEAIAEAVLRFHRDPAIEQSSLNYAPHILKMYSWKTAADQIAEWCDSKRAPQMRREEPLDIISSMPPDQSGVAIYTQKTLASAPWANRFFVPWADDRLADAVELLRRTRHQQRAETPPPQILPMSSYRPGQKPAVWVLGNSEHHIETIDLLARSGQPQDFLYLHEARLNGLLGVYHQRNRQDAALSHKIRDLNDFLGVIRPRNILVNSEYCAQLISSLTRAKEYKVQKLFLPILDVIPGKPRHSAKSSDQPLTIMHVGILGQIKQPDQIVEACELIRRKRPIRLIFSGYDVSNYLRLFKLKRSWIETREGLSDEELVALMQQVDIGIQPRWPQHGESSGAICQWLGLRKPVVATAGGSFDEFAGSAWLVAPETGADGLADAILKAAERGAPPGIDEFISKRTIAAWLIAFQSAIGCAASRPDSDLASLTNDRHCRSQVSDP